MKGPSNEEHLGMVAVTKDGKIVLAAIASGLAAVHVHRLMPDGAADTSFGTQGVATLTAGAFVTGAALDDDGGVLVALATDNTKTKVVRLLPSGQPDTAYDAKGLGSTVLGWQRLLRRGDGTPVLVGWKQDSVYFHAAFSFVTAATSPSVEHSLQWDAFDLRGGTIDPMGRVLVVGTGELASSDTPSRAFLLRTSPTGEPDGAFGQLGDPVHEAVGGATDTSTYEDVFVEPEGKILCVGQHSLSNGANAGSVVGRYDDKGFRDVGFGTGGLVVDTTAPGVAHQGAVLQTSLPALPVIRHVDPNSSVAIRYWR